MVQAAGLDVLLTLQPGRPLMVLVRMAAPEAGVWDSVWSDFARHFTVASFDLQQVPAARRMDDPAAAFRDTAQACAEVAEALGFARFHVFGWNGGSQVALRCAVDHQERVASLILLDPFFELADMRHVKKALEVKRLLFAENRELYAHYWVMAGLSDEFIASNFDEVERLAEARMRSDRFLRHDVEPFMRWVESLRRNWLSEAEFASINAPTLIVATDRDRWVAGPSAAMAREVHERIAKSELKLIEGVGGHFLIEDPSRFMSVVGPDLSRFARTC